MSTITVPVARSLRAELDAIASCELADVLAAWPSLPEGQAVRLRDYLRSELTDGGMLSISKAREAGQSLSRERAEARAVIRAIGSRLNPPD